MAQTSMLAAVGSAVFLAAGIGSGAAQTVDVNVGFAATVKMERKIDIVTVRDPDVALADIASGRTVVVFGRAAGVTDIILRDDVGKEIAVILVKVTPYQSIEDLVDISYTVPAPGFSCYSRDCELIQSTPQEQRIR